MKVLFTAMWLCAFLFAGERGQSGDLASSWNRLDGRSDYHTGRSLIRDDSYEVVVDDVAGLMWQDDLDAATVYVDWTTADSYCEQLELAGYGDWRLPTLDELIGITDDTRFELPLIDEAFQNTSSEMYYWSSELFESSGFTLAKVVGFFQYATDGGNGATIIYPQYVRCVRDGVPDESGSVSSSSSVSASASSSSESSENSSVSSASSSASGTVVSRTLSLVAGWNFISLPVDTTLEGSDKDRLGSYEKIYIYRSGQWMLDPDALDAGEGFWLKSGDSHTVTFEGQSYFPRLETLSDGWCMGGTGETLYNVSELGYVEQAYTYDGMIWHQNPEAIEPGEGFWIKISTGESSLIMEPLNPEITFTPTDTAVSLTLDESDAWRHDDGTVSIKRDYALGQNDLGKPLFINDAFLGKVESVEDGGSGVTVYALGEFETIDEVYRDFSVSFEGFTPSRSLRSLSSIPVGTFDYLNSKPMTIQADDSTRSMDQGVRLLMMIPDGYRIPTQRETRTTLGPMGITVVLPVSDDGSLEFKLGGSIKLELDMDPDIKIDATNKSVQFDIEIESWQTYELLSQLTLKLDNKVIEETPIENLLPFEITVTLPMVKALESSAGWVLKLVGYNDPVNFANMKLKGGFNLDMEIGGELSGNLVGTYKKVKGQSVEVTYDSRLQEQEAPVLTSLDENTKLDVGLSLEAKGYWNYKPYIQLYPELNLLGLKSTKFIYLNAGYNLSTSLKGVFSSLGTNDSDTLDNSLMSSIFGSTIYDWYAQAEMTGQTYIEGGYELKNVPFTAIADSASKMTFEIDPPSKLYFMDFAQLAQPVLSENGTKVQMGVSALNDYYQGKLAVDYYFNGESGSEVSRFLGDDSVEVEKPDEYYGNLHAKVRFDAADRLTDQAYSAQSQYALGSKSYIVDSDYAYVYWSGQDDTGAGWMEDEGVHFSWEEAGTYCAGKGGRLPTFDELSDAYQSCVNSGLAEGNKCQPDGFASAWFYWTNAKGPTSYFTGPSAYYFNFSWGSGDSIYTGEENSVRCYQD